jgi:hypothetical protein
MGADTISRTGGTALLLPMVWLFSFGEIAVACFVLF